MAFEGLSARLQGITKKLRGKARITESDLKEILREVKLALLEADVNYKIVKEFIADIEKKALGQNVLASLTPGQQVIKIVKDETIELLGGVESRINFTPNPPTVIMLVGTSRFQEKQQQQENLQTYLENREKNLYLLHVMYIDQQQ